MSDAIISRLCAALRRAGMPGSAEAVTDHGSARPVIRAAAEAAWEAGELGLWRALVAVHFAMEQDGAADSARLWANAEVCVDELAGKAGGEERLAS